jgi:hypothetical protein
MMSDYWIVVTMHHEDPVTGQFDKYFTRFRNCTACFSCPLPLRPTHKLKNFHLNAAFQTLSKLHHKQLSKQQFHKNQNSATMYSSFSQRHTPTETIQWSSLCSKDYSPACHHEDPGSIPDHYMWNLC